MDNNLIKKIEESRSEIFKGFFFSLLITGPSEEYIQYVGQDFCSYSSLLFLGVEVGINAYVDPSVSPDNRYGVICSIWVKKDLNNPSISVENIIKKATIRIKCTLFQKLGIKVFSWSSKDFSNQKEIAFFNSLTQLGNFGLDFTQKYQEKNREMINIPMMGGKFLIEKKFPIFEGYMGGNLFIHFSSIDKAIYHEKFIRSLINENPEICLIYALIGSGSNHLENQKISNFHNSKHEIYNISKNIEKITSNFQYCPSLKNKLKNYSKVTKNVKCIPELVVNSGSLHNIENILEKIIQNIYLLPEVIKISAGSYQTKLGSHFINIKNLFR